VNAGETLEQALCREVLEETGLSDVEVGAEFATIVEHPAAREDDKDVFAMTSHYFWCTGEERLGEQRLDDYERALEYVPDCVEPASALAVNKRCEAGVKAPWLPREILVLQLLVADLNSQPH
jgi:8-oxo-dGTP pyrophosphatase MutT (NUDIX family)